MGQISSPTLDQVLLRLILRGVFLPLLITGVVVTGSAGYVAVRTLETQQRHIAHTVAQVVNDHLNHAQRALETLARVAESEDLQDISLFAEKTWESFAYFDTLYYLSEQREIKLMVPDDSRYVGLDMSNVADFGYRTPPGRYTISRPFISLRTGGPTVYVVRALATGGLVVGELNLSLLQDEVLNGMRHYGHDSVFIMDQTGTLLAHPTFALVNQQANLGHLKIFTRAGAGPATLLYKYEGDLILGSGFRIDQTGWVVVDQTALSVALAPYIWAQGLTFLAAVGIWLILVWSLRQRLRRSVVRPLVHLSRGSDALAVGDFGQLKALSSMPSTFAELHRLAADFQRMGQAVQSREKALEASQERYRTLFDRVPVGLFRSTPAGQYLDVNPALVSMLGYPDRETLLKINVVDLYVSPIDRRTWQTQVEQYGLVRHLEIQVRRYDGTPRWVQASIGAITDDQGQVLYYDGAVEDITERRRAEDELRQKAEEIRHIAYFDTLTKLPNRAQLHERLSQEMERARCGEASGAVLFVDLDELKMVNDTFGHTYGDAVITGAGNCLVAHSGEGALVARLSGDEFIVVLPGQNDPTRAASLADELVGALREEYNVLGTRFHMSASAGVAFYPADGDTVEEILKNAENAMYAAKGTGKNCWRLYQPHMQQEAYQKIVLLNSLRHAADRKELFLNFQPQVSVPDGTIVGYEALLRWQSPEHGLVPPARFIPLAEHAGLIQAIGNWVLRDACRFARRLADLGRSDLHVAVNVSPHQLASDDFIVTVRQVLDETGVEPGQLELEITENVLMGSLDDCTRRLERLHAMGVGLSLDDFGTGFSSLTYLRQLPVNTLKIDKSFIDGIVDDASQAGIIASIVHMAHTLEMIVVAEGVETDRQLEFLTANRCDRIQGYLISRPMPEKEALQYLTKHP